MLVLLYHSEQLFAFYFKSIPTRMAFMFGHAGVDFFFVLSGFIIMWIHHKDIGVPQRLWGYLIKRLRRVYPPYWIVLLAILPLFFVVRSSGHGLETRSYELFSSFALLPTANGPILSVAWTLSYELFFYILFGLVIWHPRLGWSIMAAWIVLGLVLRGLSDWPLGFLFPRYTLHFGLGMFIAWVVMRERLSFPGVWTVSGVAIFIAIGAYDASLNPIWASAGYALSSSIVIAGVTSLDLSPQRIAWPSALLLLGDASYSLYLVHYPVLSVAAKGIRFFGISGLPPMLGFILLVSLAIAAGIIFHLLVERRLVATWPSRSRRSTPA